VSELTLRRVEAGCYTLGDLGTLRSARRHAGEIEADGETWRIRRSRLGFGGIIKATNAATGALEARYLPSGFLRLRGIYRGTIRIGEPERELEWRADHHMSEHFTLREAGARVAEFQAGSDAVPVTVERFGLHQLEPLPLLFCCHIVKRVVDMTMEVGTMGPPPRPEHR
jgi:hypothetical protein